MCRGTDERDAAGLSYDGLPNLKAWVDRVFERPAVKKGMNVPEENKMMKAMQVWAYLPACLQQLAALVNSLKLRM